MFASITQFARTAVTKYKAQRVKAVVDGYLDLVNQSVKETVPQVLVTYRHAAHHIVDKSFEQPEVALELLRAADAAIKLYGPGLATIVRAFQEGVQVESPALMAGIEQFTQTLKDLAEDTTVA